MAKILIPKSLHLHFCDNDIQLLLCKILNESNQRLNSNEAFGPYYSSFMEELLHSSKGKEALLIQGLREANSPTVVLL
ncbi:hypothetical protein Anas_02912 [Armadillidium nasatum]|uniref:Uncharacterized protein n=1 Tax=Armadillidium nasatum TaxID=96803 RepID=A0A5N5T011_9CRUS|nr:hypothetical protein Anas_02912 [Armadillidium nasatum]